MFGDRSVRLLLSICLWNCGLTASVLAQIVPDNSLGNNNSVVTEDVTIEDAIADIIEGGVVRGQNLFHSFSEFNIGNNQQVYFANPSNITNILSRVTGSNPTEILGTLGVNGAANLFFLNPNGIIFGENAALDLNGSFFATTAESFEFGDDYSYSASNPDSPPLLTVNIPVGLQFGSEIEAIEVRGSGHDLILDPQLTFDLDTRPSGLGVAAGNTLALIGGEINFSGGNVTAPAGRIAFGSVDRPEEVKLIEQDGKFSFAYDNFDAFADVNLTQASSLNLSGDGAGSLQIQAQNINLLDSSVIIANTMGLENGGSLNLQAADSFNIIGSQTTTTDFPSAIFTQVSSGAAGDGSKIAIAAAKLRLQDNALLRTSTAGSGNAGTIALDVQQAELANQTSQSFRAGTGLISRVDRGATGRGGDIEIEVRSAETELLPQADPYEVQPGELQLSGGAKIELLTKSQGEGGNLFLTADRLDVLGKVADQLVFSSINTEVSEQRGQTANNGGSLNIMVDRLRLEDSGQITSSTSGSGNAGSIKITANDIDIIGSSSTELADINSDFSSNISTSSANGNPEATGNEGNLTIESDRLTITSGGAVSSETKGIGDSGDLEVDVNTLLLENGGQISSSNNGLGRSGKLSVNAEDITITGFNSDKASGLFSSTTISEEAEVTADLPEAEPIERIESNNFTINSKNLTVRDGGEIISSTFGVADAENLEINVDNTLMVENGGRIGSFTLGEGNAGDLKINSINTIDDNNQIIMTGTRTVSNLDSSASTTPSSLFSRVEVGARGDGGEIEVKTKNLQIDRGATISANTFGAGNAGNILLDANNGDIAVRDSNEIDGIRSGISSRVENPSTGNGGDINIVNVDRLLVTDGGAIGVDAKTNEVRFSISGRDRVSAGEVNIAANNIEIRGILDDETRLPSRISAFSEGKSDSGTVTIEAQQQLQILDGAEISVRNRDEGSAGNIVITAEKLTLNGGQLDAEVNAGDRGNVKLVTGDIEIRRQGSVNTQARGSATSGNINIENSGNIFLEDSKIVADATMGNAGSIQINTSGLFKDSTSEISASSELGIDGVVELNTSFDVARSLGAAFPQKPLDPNLKSNQSCQTNDNKDNFAYVGRGGLPINPLDSIMSDFSSIDWGTNSTMANSINSFERQDIARDYNLDDRFVESNSNHLTEAVGWQTNSAGNIELIASTSRPVFSWQNYQCPVAK